MTIDYELVQKFEEAVVNLQNFIRKYNKEYGIFKIIPCKKGEYPYSALFYLTLPNLNYIEEHIFVVPLVSRETRVHYLESLNKDEIKKIDDEYVKLQEIRKYYIKELREQIIFTPLPEGPLDDLQKLVLNMDPYCKKVKEKWKNFAQKMLEPVPEEIIPRPFVTESDRKRGSSSLKTDTEAPQKYYSKDMNSLQKAVDRYTSSTIPYDSKSSGWINLMSGEDTVDCDLPDDRGSYTPIDIGSTKSRLLHLKYSLFANTLDEAEHMFNQMVEEIKNLKFIFYVREIGTDLRNLVDNMELEKKYRKIIWEDANALVERFDILAFYHLKLTLARNCGLTDILTLIQNEKDKENLIELIEQIERMTSHINGKYYFKFPQEIVNLQTKYKTWFIGQELFDTLKNIEERK